jgi:hypothetical protein
MSGHSRFDPMKRHLLPLVPPSPMTTIGIGIAWRDGITTVARMQF